MRKNLIALTVFVVLGFSSSAFAIPVGTFGNIDYWATSANRMLGTGGTYAGVDPLVGLVGNNLTDGAINIGLFQTDAFLLGFADGIINLSGPDLVIFDGRFSADGVNVEVSINNLYIDPSTFVDSGLNLVLKNTSLGFDLFGSYLDLSNWGIAANAIVYNLDLISYYPNEADIMGVGVLNSGAAVAVPEPSTLLLLGVGLIGLTGFRRKFRG